MTPAPDRESLTQILADVPVFPLPDLVFFPDTLLPLHIFEPRYRAMARRCLEGDRVMAVTRLLRGPADASGNPPFSAVAGAGYIVEHEALQDGRYNLLLRGVARVRLSELPFSPPYRRASAELIDDEGEPPARRDLSALLSLVAVYTAELKTKNSAFELRLPDLPFDQLLHHIAAALVIDPSARQRLLEETSPRRRCTQLLAEIAAQQARLSGRASPREFN